MVADFCVISQISPHGLCCLQPAFPPPTWCALFSSHDSCARSVRPKGRCLYGSMLSRTRATFSLQSSSRSLSRNFLAQSESKSDGQRRWHGSGGKSGKNSSSCNPTLCCKYGGTPHASGKDAFHGIYFTSWLRARAGGSRGRGYSTLHGIPSCGPGAECPPGANELSRGLCPRGGNVRGGVSRTTDMVPVRFTGLQRRRHLQRRRAPEPQAPGKSGRHAQKL